MIDIVVFVRISLNFYTKVSQKGAVRMKKTLNSFLINSFEFENYPCICKKETVYSAPNEDPTYVIKVCLDKSANPLKFSYSVQSGLNLSGNAGGIIEENILGKLLAIPTGDLNATVDFIERYGFIFPISDTEYESIEAKSLLSFFERIKSTILLMSAIAGKKNYSNIFIRLTYLLFSNAATITTTFGSVSTKKHPFSSLLHSFSTMPDIQRNQELFDNGFISIDDSVLNEKIKISRDVLTNMVSGVGINSLSGSTDPLFKNLFALYTNYHTTDKNLRLIIDFYYNYQKLIGIIDYVEPRKVKYYKKKNVELSDELKDAMLEVAKITISEEINGNITNIHPSYSYGSLAPSWKLSSFLEALYFSIFYMQPGIELYKECENPNCKRNKFFLVKATKQNKKYCCPECANAAAQRRSRQRKLDK